MPHNMFRRYYFITSEIVSDIEETAHKCFVTGNAFFKEFFTATGFGWLFNDKPTLRSDWNNNRILGHLRFHETKYFGSEIFLPIRPANTPTSDTTTPQMNRINARRVYKDLNLWAWQREVIHITAIDFE